MDAFPGHFLRGIAVLVLFMNLKQLYITTDCRLREYSSYPRLSQLEEALDF